MKKYLLPGNINMCIAGDVAVFLNLRSGTYFGASVNQTGVLRRAMLGCPADPLPSPFAKDLKEADTDALLLNLSNMGLLTTDESAGRQASVTALREATQPVIKGWLEPPPRIAIRHVAAILWAHVRARWSLRHQSFERISARLRTLKLQIGPSRFDVNQVRLLTLVFKRLRPFIYTWRARCLHDSLALEYYLLSFGVCATWVVGVRGRPFMAHSWVQYEDYVLNEDPFRVTRYSPILAA